MKTIYRVIIAAVFILIANLGIFILGDDFNRIFWICYVFAHLAAIVTIYIQIDFAKKEKVIFQYPIAVVTYGYLLGAIVVAFLSFVMFKDSDNALLTFLVNMIVLGIFIAAFCSVLIHNTSVKEQQEVRGANILNFRNTLNSMDKIMNSIDYSDPNKKILQHVRDSLASGQVQTVPAAAGVEQQIYQMIVNLSQAVSSKNQDQIVLLCNQLEIAIEDRKQILSQNMIF